MGRLIERQVIVTWHTPDEKLPPEYNSVVATISGKAGNSIFDHAMCMMEFARDGCGWLASELDLEFDELTVHAWCDLEPYGG